MELNLNRMNQKLLNLEICRVGLHNTLKSQDLYCKKLALYNAIRMLSDDVRSQCVAETKSIFRKHNQEPIDVKIEDLNEPFPLHLVI